MFFDPVKATPTAITSGAEHGGVLDLAPSPSMPRVREYIRASKADNTVRGYQSDWRELRLYRKCPAVDSDLVPDFITLGTSR
jgi:hypothetical protein